MSTLQHATSGSAGKDEGTAPSADGPTVAAPAREQFIPLRKAELVEKLARLTGTGRIADEFRRWCRLLESLLHSEYHGTLETLKDAYAPFDPDTDTPTKSALSDVERDLRRSTLFDRFGWLAERGNFTRLAQKEIDEALSDCSQWGLNLAVDFELFERLELYYRGDSLGTRFRRRLRKGFKNEAVQIPVYERLVLIFRFRPGRRFSKFLDTDDVYIKLFKEIPKLDLDMLLPGTQVKMSLIDRAKIMLPTASGVSMAAVKIFLAWGSTLAMWGLVGGTLGYGVRSVYGYLNTKQKYQLNLTQSLYYQNIDNNAGVIHRLIDEAEEQESREAVLAYYFLWREAPAEGWSSGELDQRIEGFLHAEAARKIDFEIDDALEKLQRFGAVERMAGGHWKAAPIERAIESLLQAWSKIPAGPVSA
jgi:hypothetical protein